MRWPSRQERKQELVEALRQHARAVRPLPGIADPRALDTFAMQMIASLRREDYFRLIQRGPVSAHRANPHDPAFEAELGVVHLLQRNHLDEAAWLVFLMTFFAKPADSGWMRLRDVYGRLGQGMWDWSAVSTTPREFGSWLADNWRYIRGTFGNHRKYESLRPDARRPMATAAESYVAWVIGAGDHRRLFTGIVRLAGNDPHIIFDALYYKFPVPGFGRLGKFDYVAMLGRYGIVPAEAGSAYLNGATGPAAGARLLFDGRRDGPSSTTSLETYLADLDTDLKVGMQVLEDALCNLQKKPEEFVHFRG
jgi:Alpha-glutamyl/putrescinyl thymine pyrophosphorylase clade 3